MIGKYPVLTKVVAKENVELPRFAPDGELVGMFIVPRGCSGIVISCSISGITLGEKIYEIELKHNERQIVAELTEDLIDEFFIISEAK